MSLFNFSQEELLTFFAVLVRFSVLIAILPVTGDRIVPGPVKVLLALSISIALFPALVANGDVHVGDALAWGSSASGIAATVAMEAIVGAVMGYVARLAFDAIDLGGNLVGTFMGFAMASTYDAHQETQSQIVAQLQLAIAMLLFLAVDGHHLMLRAALESYQIMGLGALAIGKTGFNSLFSAKLVELTGEVVVVGVLIAAPVAVSLFAVNVAFGVMAKAMPQLNILVLSMAVSALVGLFVLLISVPEMQGAASSVLQRTGDWMEQTLVAMARGR